MSSIDYNVYETLTFSLAPAFKKEMVSFAHNLAPRR